MSETSSWVLKGVDPSLRERAVEEAARLGVNLGDYLTDVVLKNALLDQMNGLFEAEFTHPATGDAPFVAPLGDGSETYAVRHRLRGLERRLNGAVHTLDDSMLDLTNRVGEMEGVVGDTVSALNQAVQDNAAAFAGIRLDLSAGSDNIAALAAAHTDRTAGLDHRIDSVEMIARNADKACAELADAQNALKHAVADDFAEFAHDVGNRLHAGLAEVRASAAEAAAEADAAIAHLIAEFRHACGLLEARVEENAGSTRAHMHAAFSDAAERLGSLAERVIDHENQAARTTESLRAQILDAEDAAQTALEETAQLLRQADAALAADALRRTQAQDAALNAARTAIDADIASMRERQSTHQQHLERIDVALEDAGRDIAQARHAIAQRVSDGEAQVRALLARAEADWNQRHHGAIERLDNLERTAVDIRHSAGAEIGRVEACTMAALEKLAADIARGDSELTAQLAQLRGQAETENALLREGVASALAHANLLDSAVQRAEASNAPLSDRIDAIAAALSDVDRTLPARVATLESAAAGVRALGGRLDAQQEELAQAVRQLDEVAGLANRAALAAAAAAAKADERAHALEMTLADQRLSQIAETAAERSVAQAAMLALQSRIGEVETAQTLAIRTMTTEIARFIEDNDRRLAALEAPSSADRDLATAFEALRKRVEDRIIGVEQRSVRMLEQVADTVAMIEQRFVGGERDQGLAQSA